MHIIFTHPSAGLLYISDIIESVVMNDNFSRSWFQSLSAEKKNETLSHHLVIVIFEAFLCSF